MRQLAEFAAVAVALTACTDQSDPVEGAQSGSASDYEQGYALVYRQADKLSNIDKLLIVKGERDSVQEVTERLANVSDSITSEIEAFVETRDSIVLDQEFLPAIEAEARNRMGLQIAGKLLLSFGCSFEQEFLFTEAIAARRMLALSQEMEQRAPDERQEEMWAGFVAELEPVVERVRNLLEPCEDGG